MKPHVKIITLFLLCYVTSTVIWFSGLAYFRFLDSWSDMIHVLLRPTLLAFVVLFVAAVVYGLVRIVKPITAYTAGGGKSGTDGADAELALRRARLIPRFFMVTIAVYALVGPQTGLLGNPDISRMENVYASLFVIPILLLVSQPFLSGILLVLERWVEELPRTGRPILSLRTKLVLIVAMTSLGLLITSLELNYNLASRHAGTVSAGKLLQMNLAASAGGIAGVLVNLAVLLLQVVRPVAFLQQEIDRLVQSGGDLKRKLRTPVRDEIGNLGEAINGFLAELRPIVARVQDGADQVAGTSKAVLELAAGAGIQSAHISEAVGEVSKGAQNQQRGLSESAHAVEELSHAIQRVAESAAEVLSASHSLSLGAQSGLESMRDAIRQMERIDTAVGCAGQLMEQLDRSTSRIGQIAAVSNEITNQINLLALNASIEAARAGEHGRGFQVVAAEVKKLANRSLESMSEIHEIVARIQTDSSEALTQMRQGAEEAVRGTDVVLRTGELFEQMARHIQSVGEQIEEVSAASEEMTASSEEITSTVSELSQIAYSFVAHSEGVAQFTEEQRKSVESIQTSVEALDRLAGELNELTRKFTA